MTRKQDQTKPWFFDLPAELRLTVYEYLCAALLIETRSLQDERYQNLTNASGVVIECTTAPKWARYWASICNAQLISHQLSDELVPLWTNRAVFKRTGSTNGPSCYINGFVHTAPIRIICREIHNFVDRFGRLVRQNAKKIRFRWNLLGPDLCKDSARHMCERLEDREAIKLMPSVAAKIGLLLEKMHDVHPDLTIQVELEMHMRISHNDIEYLRQVVSLRQKPLSSREDVDSPAWVPSDIFMLKKFASCDGLTWGGPASWHFTTAGWDQA